VLHVWCRSRCTKFYNDLEVGYVGFIGIARAGALNPAFGLQGYVDKHLFTVTALLINRSLAIRGCIKIKKIFASNPNSLVGSFHGKMMFQTRAELLPRPGVLNCKKFPKPSG
jgi:hypothetical protein